MASKVLNLTNSTISETTYKFLSDHIGLIIMTVVQRGLNIVCLEIEYTVLLNTLTMKQLTTSLYLINK